MSPLRPRQHLETHEVTNQPPPFENVNLFESDLAFVDAIAHAGGRAHLDRLRGSAPVPARRRSQNLRCRPINSRPD